MGQGVWFRRLLWSVGALLAVWALAWLAVPPLLKWQAQARLGELLGRPVTLGVVSFQPWSLELTVTDIVVGAAPGAATDDALLQVARLHVDADISSVLRRAPVIEALDVDGLRLRVAHTAPGHYDIDDLITRFAPRDDEPAAQPARFALHNLQLRDASLRLDDRPARRIHAVEALALTLPFVSNLPSDIEVRVEPRLAFALNGTAFDSGAQATPFSQVRRGELKLAFTNLDLAPYLGYLPAALPVRLQRGALSADVALQFSLPAGGPRTVALTGMAAAQGLAIGDAAGAPLFGWERLRLELRDVQPLARKLAFGSLRIEGAQLQLTRAADGRLNLQGLAGPAAAASAPAAPASASAPTRAAASSAGETSWQVALDKLEVDGARVLWSDATTTPPAALQLDGVALRGQQLQWPVTQPMPMSLAATLRAQTPGAPAQGHLAAEGSATDHEAHVTMRVSDLALQSLAPYLAQVLTPSIAGAVSLQGRLDWADAANAPRLALSLDTLSLDGLRLSEGAGRAAREIATLRQLALADTQLELLSHQVVLGKVSLVQPMLALARDREGLWNVQRWTPSPAGRAASAQAPATAESAPWQVRLKDLALDGGTVRLADASAGGRATDEPLRVDASALRLRVRDFAWPGGRGVAPARVQLAARLGAPSTPREAAAAKGSVDWNGRFAVQPLQLGGRLRIERLPVHLFEPYFGAHWQLSLLRAELGYQGELALSSSASGWSVNVAGDALLGDVRVHTRPESGTPAGFTATDELLSWQALKADGIRFTMTPAQRPQLELREASLSDFYSRLVITEQGRFNLRDVAAPPGAAASAASASAPEAAASAASAPAPAGGPAELPLDISVGGVRLANGRVDFTDRFVRPNFSANLSELNGRLGAFRSGTREMATLELRGRAAGTALLDIRGALNPTADPLALDIQAKATDLELAPLSPYAGKYAGYAIERGKLSMDVAYKIDPDGKLDAKNQVILNQLTFGDKVESPDATKLPVLLAVALLKDRNGVIDINLPISGSINDPQFSVFGIVLKVIGNLLVKALTAPFALLAGGGSDDLSLVEFKPGIAVITDAGGGALDKVAKALADRPSLKMTVTGAADPVSEREAFQRAALETRLLAERRRELLRGGASQASADAPLTLDAQTRARLLKEVYRQTDLPNKPRNAIGFARDIPGPEMETLLNGRTVVSVEAMRELALQRGLAVRDALVAKGLPSERLFLAAPKLRASGEDDATWTPRVQLALSVN